MKIQESAEDYLETILMLKEHIGQVRSIDIVNETGYTKPSISVAMKKLRENGYINIDSDGYITLIGDGLEIATRMYDRHQTLAKFLMALGVSEKTALADACKIEHDISDESYQCIKKHFKQTKGR
ncbi:metal-dependent transcriptional regulator [Brassicibacter mesophilus]|uniref:metal-dependent transcriptional regulator n=1 Tax=Brassicibacter mesophilus TaxID=745119 RepID=UPI003D2365A4